MKYKVMVGFPNEGDVMIDYDVVSKWDPKDIKYIGNRCFFEDKFKSFSMEVEEFQKVFKEKLA